MAPSRTPQPSSQPASAQEAGTPSSGQKQQKKQKQQQPLVSAEVIRILWKIWNAYLSQNGVREYIIDIFLVAFVILGVITAILGQILGTHIHFVGDFTLCIAMFGLAGTFLFLPPVAILPWSMVVDGGRWWSMVVDGGRWWSMVVDGGRWWSMVVDGGRWWSMVVDGGRWWSMVVDGGRWMVVTPIPPSHLPVPRVTSLCSFIPHIEHR